MLRRIQELRKIERDQQEIEESLKDQVRDHPEDKEAQKMLADLLSRTTPWILGSHPTTPAPTFPAFETWPTIKEYTTLDWQGKDVLYPLLPIPSLS